MEEAGTGSVNVTHHATVLRFRAAADGSVDDTGLGNNNDVRGARGEGVLKSEEEGGRSVDGGEGKW